MSYAVRRGSWALGAWHFGDEMPPMERQLFVNPLCIFSAVLEILRSEYQIISFGIKVSNHTASMPQP